MILRKPNGGELDTAIYRTHCQAIGRIIAAATVADGKLSNDLFTKSAIDTYLRVTNAEVDK